MVSHELKTPLTTIMGITELVLAVSKQNNDVFASSALKRVVVQAKKMTGMINGFLNISRLESGKIVIAKELFDINGLIEETVDESKLTAADYQINFVPGPVIVVNADRDKIASVLSNLLNNAVKYSHGGKNIEIRTQILQDALQVSVQDNGIGIKTQHLDRIFERYYRVDGHYINSVSGFGIGLYLSAEIVLQHSGSIWATSESGKGSTFYFTLAI